MKPSNPSLLIFLGAPGSGKGTQSNLISETLRLSRIEMGKLLQTVYANAKEGDYYEIDGKKYFVADQQKRQNEGLLCEASFVIALLRDRLIELYEKGESVVLDGFPRSVEQIEGLLPWIFQSFSKENIKVIYLNVSEEASLKRNSTRRMCELMRHPILSIDETENLTLCPLDGSKLQKRADDDPEAIKIRLTEFKKQTVPLMEYFKQKAIEVETVDADKSVADVFGDVLKVANSAGL